MAILVRPAAAADIEEAFFWYESKREGLGAEFLSAVQSTLDDVRTHPAMCQVLHRDARRALVQRFPYGVYYRIYGEDIVIVACMHVRRNPRLWKSR